MSAKAAATNVRNPGPGWGYRFLREADRYCPAPIMALGTYVGTAIACLFMPTQRRASREYLRHVLGRNPSRREIVRHFYAFTRSLMLKFRFSRGLEPGFSFSRDSAVEPFLELCTSDGPVLFGTLHVGHSDLMGCLLTRLGRRVHMVRLRVGNSDDIRWLEEIFGDTVRFLWVNEPDEVLFRIKDALQQGHALALQCDRVEFGARRDRFRFLGRQMEFPVTIYHLAALFRAPVVFSFAVPANRHDTVVHVSKVFHPQGDLREVLASGHRHFQETLTQLERILEQHPFAWFNFTALPIVEGESE